MSQFPNFRFSLQPPRLSKSSQHQYFQTAVPWYLVFLVIIISLLSGCEFLTKQESSLAQEQKSQSSVIKTAVDVVVALEESLSQAQEYIGTTQPITELSLRSQVAGTLISLSVEVGDQVRRGQVIGQIDDTLLLAAVNQEKSELASLESELAKAQIEVKNAEIQVEEAQVRLEQAESERERYQNLAEQGLISRQEAESFATAAKVAQKAVLLAEESVKIARQAVSSQIGRVEAQQSVVAESIQRQAYTKLIAETTGIVTHKVSEPGNLVREGEEILKIGDFNPIKVVVPLSELDLDRVTAGQTVAVKLDAFPESNFSGRVNRIAPVSNVATRQIPIEIVIPNPDNVIKGGLLTRVSFMKSGISQVAISESAVIEEDGKNYVFVVAQENSQKREAVVTKREVELGTRANQKVAILKGVESGEKVVLRSSQPLNDGETVGLSIISE
ncbi:MAG: efflux RND transporter periplasmic adaptor subunit [Xenococcaceae cyanobacterium MO_167.B27]|nr:efflux RND transporter periplasmic adaptor subunit [Xenococcaceae cyanobacterium MO_167.B27]